MRINTVAILFDHGGLPLGVDAFGRSGSRAALYAKTGIDAAQITNAACSRWS